MFVLDHFFVLDAFLSTGNIVRVVRITWGIYGVTIFTVVTNFYLTVLEVPELQITIPRKANYLPHFAEA